MNLLFLLRSNNTSKRARKSRPPSWLTVTITGLAILAFSCLITVGVAAQEPVKWVPDQPLPNYEDRRPPALIADPGGFVHAFNDRPLNDDVLAIFYRQWSLEKGWTDPVDIMLIPRLISTPGQQIFLDQAGILHMVFFTGDDQELTLKYTTAPATDPANAKAWSKPRMIAERAGPLASVTLVGDTKGNLVVLYCGQEDRLALYEIHSTDSGATWSEPRVVEWVYDEQRWPTSMRADWDAEGRLHAVWSVANDRALGEGVYYARLESDLSEWSTPFVMAVRDEDDYSANWPSIVVFKDEIIVVYMDDAPPTRFMRRSRDGGQTWTEPIRLFPHIGEYENAVFAIDSSETLHMVLGNRIGQDPEIHGMWHSVWLGERWSELQPIVSAPLSSEFDPSAPRATISQGNVLLVAWWHNATMAEVAWYSYGILKAPRIAAVPWPTPLATPTVMPVVISTPNVVTSTATVLGHPLKLATDVSNVENEGVVVANRGGNPALPILLGVAPIIIIAVALILRFYLRQ